MVLDGWIFHNFSPLSKNVSPATFNVSEWDYFSREVSQFSKVLWKGAWGRTFFTKKVSTKTASFAKQNEPEKASCAFSKASSPKASFAKQNEPDQQKTDTRRSKNEAVKRVLDDEALFRFAQQYEASALKSRYEAQGSCLVFF